MPALAAAGDLAAICACVFYLALLLVASYIVGVLLGFTNKSILGTHPFAGIVNTALNAINKTIDAQILATNSAITRLWQGFTWLIREGGNAIGALAGATYGTFEYLAGTKIGLVVQAMMGNVTADVKLLQELTHDLSNTVGGTSTSVGERIEAGIKEAEGYTDAQINDLTRAVTKQINTGVSNAETVAGQLVGQVSSTFDKRVTALEGDFADVPDEIRTAVAKIPVGLDAGDVSSAIQQALSAGGSIYNEISSRIAGLGGSITEQDITNAISDALGPGAAIYNEIESLIPTIPGGLSITDVTNEISKALSSGGSIADAISEAVGGATGGLTEQDITTAISDALLPTGAIGLAIASAVAGIAIPVPPGGVTIPTPSLADVTKLAAATAATVAGIEAISFIGGDECRGKVGNICNVEQNAWEKLLEGAALVALDFDFAELVNACSAILPTVEQAVTAFE